MNTFGQAPLKVEALSVVYILACLQKTAPPIRLKHWFINVMLRQFRKAKLSLDPKISPPYHFNPNNFIAVRRFFLNFIASLLWADADFRGEEARC